MSAFRFEIIHTSVVSRARVGIIHTPHGPIYTPAFVGVGTHASLKAIDPIMLNAMDLDLLFCNTYHLMVQPGTELIKAAGGLHCFMNRSKPIITDSGGFQVFSLAYGTVFEELKSSGKKKHEGSVINTTEQGVLFRSYKNGDPLLLTPETSVQAQKDLGADIIIPFDELPPYNITPHALKKALERTHRWEKRSLEAHKANPQHQAMYGVIHGGIDTQLRAHSAQYLNTLGFDGMAIGGSVGKNRQEMIQMLTDLMPHIDTTNPVHLLGIGDTLCLENIIKLGIDTFDSSYPTRCARHALIFNKHGNLKMLQSKYKLDFNALQDGCSCYTCTHYTRAYIHHLFKARELTALSLSSIHNVHHMIELTKQYRNLILHNQL